MKRTSRRPRRNPSPLDSPAFRRWFGDSKVVDERGEPLVVYHGTNAHAYSPGERIEVFGTGSRGGAFFSNDPVIASQYGERVYAVYLRLESPLVLDAAGRGWTDLRGSSRIDGRITAPVRAALRADQQRQRKAAEREAELLDDLFAELAELESEEPAFERGPIRTIIDPDAPSLSGHTLSDLLRIEPDDALETDDVAKAARGLGFDGVIFRNVQDSPARGAGYSRVLSDIYAVFEPTQIKSATDNVGTYDPSDPSILKNRRTSRPRRNPELLKKGTRLTGSFADDGTGWRYSGDYPSVRGQRWVASLGLSRGELSVEGATEYDPGFRSSLVQMAAEYPELLDLDAKFDGPRIPVAALVQSGVPTIDRTLWLHGTSSAVLDSVMASGLRPRRETGAAAVFVGAAKESRPQYVYLTTQRNMARMAARAAARASGGVPVVLRVEPLPVGRMQPDEDSGTEMAEESLWRIGSVAYEGSIAPGKIAVDEVLKDGEWSAPVSGNRRTSRRSR